MLLEVYTDEQGGLVGWSDLDHPPRTGRGSYPGGDMLEDRDEMRADAMRWYNILSLRKVRWHHQLTAQKPKIGVRFKGETK
jgi:hypothetical protein